MKYFPLILGALGVILLASCGSMSSGGMGMSSEDGPVGITQHVFDPRDPYHGG